MLDERIPQTSWVVHAFRRAKEGPLPLLTAIAKTGGIAAVVLARRGLTEGCMGEDPSLLERDAERDERLLLAAVKESHGAIVDTGCLLLAYLKTDAASIRFLLECGVSLDDQLLAEIKALREQDATPPRRGDPTLDITARSEAYEVQRARKKLATIVKLIKQDFEGADTIRKEILALDEIVEGITYDPPSEQEEGTESTSDPE